MISKLKADVSFKGSGHYKYRKGASAPKKQRKTHKRRISLGIKREKNSLS